MWYKFLNTTTGLSLGFFISATYYHQWSAVALFGLAAWLSLTALLADEAP